MIDIGFTGTQDGITELQFASLSKLIAALSCFGDKIIFHNGDCVGADEEAAIIARSFGWHVHLHPPKSNAKRAFIKADFYEIPLDYLDRNKNIVKKSIALIACPKSEETLRSGTWSTVRYARGLHKRIYIVYPDGHIEVENV